MTLTLVFVIIALLLFLGAAIAVPVSRVHLGWLGMIFLAIGVWLIPLLK